MNQNENPHQNTEQIQCDSTSNKDSTPANGRRSSSNVSIQTTVSTSCEDIGQRAKRVRLVDGCSAQHKNTENAKQKLLSSASKALCMDNTLENMLILWKVTILSNLK